MKKTFIIFFALFINLLFSQEIHSIYKFKKQEQRKIFYYYELDSLVLYKNGKFHQTFSYNYHEIKYREIAGDWKIENGKLLLNISKIKEIDNWINSTLKYNYLIKKRKLVPIIEGYNPSSYQKLKLIKR